MLKKGVEHARFIQKMQTDSIKESFFQYRVITPLKAMRYTYPETEQNVCLDDVHLFSVAAILLSLCALLNYLTLFISRLRSRGRDMALRAICGSSGWQTSKLLMTEYLMLLLGALLFSMLFIEIMMGKFVELSMIQVERSEIYAACIYLLLFSVVLALLLSFVPIYYFKRKTLRVQIESAPVRVGKNHFRMISVCIQLIVGMLFMFCAIVMIKQVYMLMNVDNIERKNIAWVTAPRAADLINDVLKQLPFIKETEIALPLYPVDRFRRASSIRHWDEKSEEIAPIEAKFLIVNDDVARFYGLKMKEGPHSFNLEKDEVFINETLARLMNVDNPIGKLLDGK